MNIAERISKAKNRLVRHDTIVVDPSIPLPTRRLLLSQIPLFNNRDGLAQEAIRLFIEMHPPIAYEAADKQYHAIGNLRSVEMASVLPKKTKIRIRVITKPRKEDIEILCLHMEFLTSISFGLDVRAAPGTCLTTWERLLSISPKILASISPAFEKKGSFLEALGINRRISSLTVKSPRNQ